MFGEFAECRGGAPQQADLAQAKLVENRRVEPEKFGDRAVKTAQGPLNMKVDPAEKHAQLGGIRAFGDKACCSQELVCGVSSTVLRPPSGA